MYLFVYRPYQPKEISTPTPVKKEELVKEPPKGVSYVKWMKPKEKANVTFKKQLKKWTEEPKSKRPKL